jgi:hypothetical protein
MTGKIHWLRADGGEVIEPADSVPARQALQKFVEGGIEFVWVLYKERRTCMVVNELGANHTEERSPLPVNLAASTIYAAASRRRNAPPSGIPRIHGNAVLLENIQVD